MMNAIVDSVAQPGATERTGPATFLLDGEGCMSVRVKPGLMLGEDADRRLLMARVSKHHNVLEFFADPQGALCMRAAGSHVLLNGTVEVRELAVIPATMLHLPHNALYLSGSQTRGEIRHHVRVKARATAVRKPQKAQKAQKAPSERKLPLSAPRKTPDLVGNTLNPTARDFAEGGPRRPVSPGPKVAPRTASPLAVPRRRVGGAEPSRLKVLNSYTSFFIGFVVVGALIAAMLLRNAGVTWTTTSTPAAVTHHAPAPVVTGRLDEVLGLSAPVTAPAGNIRGKPAPRVASVEEIPTSAGIPLDTEEYVDEQHPPSRFSAPVNLAASSDSLSIDARLAEASNRLQQGMVIWPQRDSAVDWIEGVLALEPQDPQALDMLDAAANMLVTIAADAYEQGFRYDARNLLEEVLRFNPQHDRAQSLWESWVSDIDPEARDASRIRGNESST